jgi:membrane-associated protease RseP (regulator of RpoE activity)
VSEDTPQGTPGDEAATTPATPEPAAAPEAPAAAPEAPAAATPAAESPVPPAPAPEAETVAAPAAPAPAAPAPAAATPPAPGAAGYAAPGDPTVGAPVAAAPVAAAAAPPAAPRNGFFIPRWVGYVAIAIVGVLIVGGIGYAIGHENSSSSGSNAGANFPRNGNFPGFGNGNQNGNGNGNGTVPGNGNGNQNGNGNTSGGFLGVAIQDVAEGTGAQVTAVQSGSPAADAGLKSGDVITKVDSTDVSGAAALAQAIRSHAAGDSVTITYTRDGNTATAKVTLGNAASSSVQPS